METRLIIIILMLCTVGAITGCFPIQLPPRGDLSPLEDDIEDLVDKAATKIEVIEKLGNPLRYKKTSMSYIACGSTTEMGWFICFHYLACGSLDVRGSECFELVLAFDDKSRLLSYQEIPWQEDYNSAEEEMNLQKLADQGDYVARRLWEQSPFGVGTIPENPTEEDLVRLCQAADLGQTSARNELGELYLYGSDQYRNFESLHISSDLSRSCMWFDLAHYAEIIGQPKRSNTQHLSSSYKSAEVERTAKVMTAHELAEAEHLIMTWEPGQCDDDISQDLRVPNLGNSGIAALCMAADKGSFSARHKLGQIYYFGSDGVEVNLSLAYMWYHLADKVYLPLSLDERIIQTRCDAMTPKQRSTAMKLLLKWKPGKCEQNLLRN